jgi:hypothetical protein
MNLVLEADDIFNALKWYAEKELGVDFSNGEASVLVTADGQPVGALQATIRGVKPRKSPPVQVKPVERPVVVEGTVPRPAGRLAQALDMFSQEMPDLPEMLPLPGAALRPVHRRDWNTSSARSTDLAALGKEDPSDMADEIGT